MSFRQFGGLNYSSKHNIVSSNYTKSNNLLITQNIGQPNSYINYLSDISGNIKIYGNFDLSGNLSVRENTDISGNLIVNGTIGGSNTFDGNVNITDDLTANRIFLSSEIINPSENGVVPKSYVDMVASGLVPVGKVRAISTYDSSFSDPLNTFPVPIYTDLSGSDFPFYIDGISIEPNYNVLLNDQNGVLPSVNNGVYYLIQTNLDTYQFQRSTSILPIDSSSNNAFVSVAQGDINGLTGWVQTNTDDNNTVGITPIIFSNFYNFNYRLGEGLYPVISNNQVYINVDSSLNFLTGIDASNGATLDVGTNTSVLNIGNNDTEINIKGNNYIFTPYSIGSALSPPNIDLSYNHTSTQVTFNWNIPNNGISSSIPYSLQNINAVLYSNINGNIKTYNILSNNTQHINTLNQIIITNQNSATGFINNASYNYYNSDFINMQDSSSNQLILWYTNYSPYPNVSYIGYSAFQSIGVPSTVLFLQAINTQATTSSNGSVTLKCYVEYTDESNLSTGPPLISNYQIPINGYSTSGSTRRYPSPYPDPGLNVVLNASGNNSSAGSSNAQNFIVYNMFPDCSYNFNVKSQNNSNSNYGAIGSYYFKTLQPTYPVTINPGTNNLFNSTGKKYTNGSVKFVSTTNIVDNDVINASDSSWTDWTSSPITTPVQTSLDYGGTGLSLMDISCNLSTNTYTLNINGFPSNTYPTAGSSSNITLNATTIDSYNTSSIYNQGFYLNCNTYISIYRSYLSSLAPTPTKYISTLTTRQKGTSGTNQTYSSNYSFYIDNLNSAPSYSSISNFSINSSNNYYSTQVSGIWVLGYYIGTNIQYNIAFTVASLNLTNMGDYFYSSPLVTYNSNGGSTMTGQQETNLTNVLPSSINAGGYFNPTVTITNNNIQGTIVSSYNTNGISLNINYNNIKSSNNTNNISNISVISDIPSVILANSIKTLNVLGTISTQGYRVWSANPDYGQTMNPTGIVPYVYIANGGSTPTNSSSGSTTSSSNKGYIDLPYNNIWNISSNTLTNHELLISNGGFTTNSSNYLDYSIYNGNGNQNAGINYNTLNGTKYATFAWNFPSNSTLYTQLYFVINFSSPLYKNQANNNFSYFDNNYSKPLQLYYRFEYTNNVTTWSNGTSNIYPNTTWISINSTTTSNTIATTSNTIATTTICNFSNANNVYWFATATTNNSNQYTFKTSLPSLGFSSYNSTLYLRIGIPDDETTTFSNVSSYVSQ